MSSVLIENRMAAGYGTDVGSHQRAKYVTKSRHNRWQSRLGLAARGFRASGPSRARIPGA